MNAVQGNLALDTGSQLAELGATRAAARADRVSPGWSECAMRFADGFLKVRQNFTAEDLREASRGHVPLPPDARAWGMILRQLARARKIRRTGYVNASNPIAHSCPKALWEVL